MHQTYVETAALVAIMNGDTDEADGLLADFLPNELSEFEDYVDTLAARIRVARLDNEARADR